MELSLEDSEPSNAYKLDSQDLKVAIPLTRCLNNLREKHNAVAKIHQERFAQVKSKRNGIPVWWSLNVGRARSSTPVLFLPP